MADPTLTLEQLRTELIARFEATDEQLKAIRIHTDGLPVLNTMTDIDLNFISRQLKHVLADQRIMRSQLADIRDELTLLREQLRRIQGSAITRLNDTITMDILDRLRILETR